MSVLTAQHIDTRAFDIKHGGLDAQTSEAEVAFALSNAFKTFYARIAELLILHFGEFELNDLFTLDQRFGEA